MKIKFYTVCEVIRKIHTRYIKPINLQTMALFLIIIFGPEIAHITLKRVYALPNLEIITPALAYR